MTGRSIFAAVAAAAVCFGWGASFRAVEKVLYSWGVMVRKKLPLGAEFSGRGGIWGGVDALTGRLGRDRRGGLPGGCPEPDFGAVSLGVQRPQYAVMNAVKYRLFRQEFHLRLRRVNIHVHGVGRQGQMQHAGGNFPTMIWLR